MARPFSEEYALALALAREAGLLFIQGFSAAKRVEEKLSTSDVVTETDTAIEKLIMTRIAAEFPSHNFIGEETVSECGNVTFDERPTWIVDPIDGTMNFVHRYPHTCIVIGFAHERVMQFGVIYNPVLDQLYTARRGEGAQLNGFPLRVSGQKDLVRAQLICEMGGNRTPETIKTKLENIAAVTSEPEACHGLRMQGSAALNMCAVAEGAADGYWESGMHIWDIAAASLIVTEAGGVVVSPKTGEELDLTKRRVIAASSAELARTLQSKITHIDYPAD